MTTSRTFAARAAALVAVAGAVKAVRWLWIEPLAVEVACRAGATPMACAARDGILWMQVHHGFGFLSLALGGVALAARLPFWVSGLAFACGMAAVLGYDATLGVAGSALAAWSWVSPPGQARPGATSAG